MSFQNTTFIHKDKDRSDLFRKNTFRCLNVEQEKKGMGKYPPPTPPSS